MKLGQGDLISILKGVGIVALGAVLVYASQYLMNVNYGVWTPLVVALLSTIVNVGRKLLDGKVE